MRLGLKDLTAEAVRPHVGQVFVFARPQEQGPAGEARLKLVEVSVPQYSKSSPSGFRPPFSLLFELEEGISPLGEGLHRVLHDEFEPEEWQIGRVHVMRHEPGRAYYESAFA